jgi:lysozyme
MADKRAPIFGAIRAAIGPLKAAQVTIIDAALDQIGVPREGQTLTPAPASTAERKVSERGLQLVKDFEGCGKRRADGRLDAYPDPGTGGAPWTIGWGSTTRDGKAVKKGDIWTQQEADYHFALEMAEYAREVAKAIGNAPTTQNQFDALVSFHYNTGAIGRATLTKKHIAGDYVGAKAEFARWNKAGNRVMAGLTRRRKAEADLYATK